MYRRYASLYFVAGISSHDDNELYTLDAIHLFVETLDKYFGNVCELDLIFNFHRAYFLLDEMMLGGELQDSCKKDVLKIIETHDDIVDAGKLGLLEEDHDHLAGLRA